ncbi:MAG TPA: excinuclease ABC subunit UvrA [Methanocella sp.]|nr:excinuclease ABC subunit UvrA [Methanocella sp.]
MTYIEIAGARVHNLRHVSLRIPRNQIIAITGVSGSGKSSFAFDLLFAEGRKRYLQAIGFPDYSEMEKNFDSISGLPPAVAVGQRTYHYANPRSTVGTRTGLYYLLRQLFLIETERGRGLRLRDLSFNDPAGWCPKCRGTGYIQEFHERKLVPDPSRNLFQICEDGAFGGIKSFTQGLADVYGFDIETPYSDLSAEIRQAFLYGTDRKVQIAWNSERFHGFMESEFEGVIPHLRSTLAKTSSAYRISKIEREFMTRIICPACGGHRMGERARSALINGRHIGELADMSMSDLEGFLKGLSANMIRTSEGQALLAAVLRLLGQSRLSGISYLSLNRSVATLSGGEFQRLSLMTHLSSDLDSLLYILDEPSQGMHELEKASLSALLQQLKARGNTVILVEHDRSLIVMADHVVDFGPGAGRLGGRIVFQGSVEKLKLDPVSLTGKYLRGGLKVARKARVCRRKVTAFGRYLRLTGAATNNLKSVDVDIPLGAMVGVAGVSGCGKSSLITDTLVPLLQERLSDDGAEELGAAGEIRGAVSGWEPISGCVVITQSPIGRTSTSNPASYMGVWDGIRKVFAKQKVAQQRGYSPGHFSFNSGKGSCPRCGGAGTVEIPLSSFSSVDVQCSDCDGSGYKPEILEISYFGKNIRDVLDMTAAEALDLFKDVPSVCRYLKILGELGMGYITLGQPAPTLSGGEAQRIKLAKALGKPGGGGVLYVLDEPTAGLHDHDIDRLLTILDRLVDRGNTVLVIEHNLDVLSYTDHLIELGPGGGPDGGRLMASGTPEEVASNPGSILAPFLRQHLEI